MRDVLGDGAPSLATIHRWCAEFKRGRLSTEDEHRFGHPVETCTDDSIQRVQDLIRTDR